MAVRARGAGDAAKDRSIQRVECFESRSCVVRDACCRPRAASLVAALLSRFAGVGVVVAWCVLVRVLAPTSSSPSALRASPASRVCSVCLLPVPVVSAGAASRHRRRCAYSPVCRGRIPLVPFGHSQHVAAEHEIRDQLIAAHGIDTRSGRVDERACFAALSSPCGRWWRGARRRIMSGVGMGLLSSRIRGGATANRYEGPVRCGSHRTSET